MQKKITKKQLLRKNLALKITSFAVLSLSVLLLVGSVSANNGNWEDSLLDRVADKIVDRLLGSGPEEALGGTLTTEPTWLVYADDYQSVNSLYEYGDLEVDGTAWFDGTLNAAGALDIGGNLTVTGTLNAAGAATLQSSLAVTGSSTLDGGIAVDSVFAVTDVTGFTGVGTTTPLRALEVLDASNPQLRLTQSVGGKFSDLQTTGGGFLYFFTGGYRFGFNTSTPNNLLDVDGGSLTSSTVAIGNNTTAGKEGDAQLRMWVEDTNGDGGEYCAIFKASVDAAHAVTITSSATSTAC